MTMLKAILASFLLLASFAGAHAEDTSLQRLHNFLAKAGNLQADFRQVMVDEKGVSGKESSGAFYLQRPGKFRWNYAKPYQQEIVSNGGKVWFYDVDLEQVTVKKLNQAIGSTPALLLMGETPLEKNFKIESQDRDEGLYWIKLIPKDEDSGFKSVLIGLNGDNLAGMELSDNFGQLTRIYFSNLKLGAKQDAARFEFKPPAGVDVFEEK
jgi:outer membrane lipoprotein carrier protein